MSEDRFNRLGDRGQLLLVGAVSIALIILGLVVVYNTILFTDTQEPTQSLEDTTDSRTLRVQMVNTTRKLVQFTAEDKSYDCTSGSPDGDDFETEIEERLNGSASIREGLTQIKAKGGVRYVTITSVDADCVTSGDPDSDVTVELTLVIRTPEVDYETTIERTYDPDP